MLERQKTILIITHAFPPIIGGNVMRMLKFCKYLPDFGWKPIVITANPADCYYSHGWSLDTHSLTEINEKIELYQTPSYIERFLKSINKTAPHNTQINFPDKEDKNNSSLLISMFNQPKKYLKRFQVFQDLSGLWVPFAYQRSKDILKNKPVDVILTTSPPHMVHIVGYWLKKKIGKPWIIDFRDGWIGNPLFESRSDFRNTIDHRLEKRIVDRADIVIGVTNHILKTLQNNYPYHTQKYHLLRNGFDPADFSQHYTGPSENNISFVHLGKLGGQRDPTFLMQAFKEIFDSKLLDPEKTRLKLIGKWFRDDLPKPWEDFIEIIDTIPHSDAIREMQNAGVLILITGADEGEAAFTSKVFEYLASRRPILALTPKHGELSDLLKTYSNAVLTRPNDVNDIKTGILLSHKKATEMIRQTPNDINFINQFNRQMQTGELVKILETIT